MLADVPGDTVFALKLPEPHSNVRPQFVKGVIKVARIEADGSLSYQFESGPFTNTWFPAHLCVGEDGYKRWLVGLLEEHGYKPLKFEHIAKAVENLVIGEGFYRDLLGIPPKEEPADAISE